MVFLDHFDMLEEFLVLKRARAKELTNKLFNRKDTTNILKSQISLSKLTESNLTSEEQENSNSDETDYDDFMESINEEEQAKKKLFKKMTDFRKEEI